MSDTEPHLLDALLAVQQEVGTLRKDATNPHYKSKYTPLDTIVETVGPLLAKNKLVWMTLPVADEHGQPALYYRLAHAPTGEQIDGTMPLLLSKQDAQGMGSAITYARRYSMCAVLNLVADDDDDGNGAAAAGPSGRVSSTAEPSEQQLKFLKNLIKRQNADPNVLRTMLRGVGADGVDPTKDGWSKALKRDQVSRLIDVLQEGVLPTGGSDVPSDAGEFAPPSVPDDAGVPFQ